MQHVLLCLQAFQQQLEQLIQETTGMQIDLEDVEFSGDENGMRIEIE